ncbi:MAG TPA: ATP-binding protein [Thermoanaerobaculia bacterium]
MSGRPGPRPGEASLAHGGVLFLDDLPEVRRDVLEALGRVVDEGHVTVLRDGERLSFPARFNLVAAMSGCPCGHFGDRRRECRCPRPRQPDCAGQRCWMRSAKMAELPVSSPPGGRACGSISPGMLDKTGRPL